MVRLVRSLFRLCCRPPDNGTNDDCTSTIIPHPCERHAHSLQQWWELRIVGPRTLSIIGIDTLAHTSPITTRCRSLIPLGAGTVVGVKGRPLFTRPMAVWHHLRRMQQYSAERWALQQQAQVSQWKRKTPQGQAKPAGRAAPTAGHRERYPGRGGAKRSIGAYGMDFYARPVLPRAPGTDCGTKWRGSRTVPGWKWGVPISPRRVSALGPSALKLGRGCRGCGYATHTNTDNVPPCGSGQGGKALLRQRPP